MHCPKNNLNFRIKTEPVTVDAHSTDNLFFLAQMYEYLLYSTAGKQSGHICTVGARYIAHFFFYAFEKIYNF